MLFDNVSGRLGIVYNGLWDDKKLLDKVGMKEADFRLPGKEGEEKEAIQKAFKIFEGTVFERKFEQATEGNGQEREKILTLHSSSRLSLLCFYHLDGERSLTINIEGKDIKFNRSVFEFKNPVINTPSNMDVVLVSEDDKVVLFLESKFTEYYVGAAKKGSAISEKYVNKDRYSGVFYKENVLKAFGLKKITSIDDEKLSADEFKLATIDKSDVYLDGFKQMICHYMGIRRRLDKDDLQEDSSAKQKEVIEAISKEDCKIYLAEILYDNFLLPEIYSKRVLKPARAYAEYTSLYKKLAIKMNDELKKAGIADRFKVLENSLKYTEVMKNNSYLEEITKQFYRLG